MFIHVPFKIVVWIHTPSVSLFDVVTLIRAVCAPIAHMFPTLALPHMYLFGCFTVKGVAVRGIAVRGIDVRDWRSKGSCFTQTFVFYGDFALQWSKPLVFYVKLSVLS